MLYVLVLFADFLPEMHRLLLNSYNLSLPYSKYASEKVSKSKSNEMYDHGILCKNVQLSNARFDHARV